MRVRVWIAGALLVPGLFAAISRGDATPEYFFGTTVIPAGTAGEFYNVVIEIGRSGTTPLADTFVNSVAVEDALGVSSDPSAVATVQVR